MFFATCSVAGVSGLSRSMFSTYSITADVSGEPVSRNARTKARRFTAICAHCWSGCSHAPRPGRLAAGSTVTEHVPFPSVTATTRSNSAANSRFRHPTQVRTGPTEVSEVLRCDRAGVSRWITAESTAPRAVVRNAGHNCQSCTAPGRTSCSGCGAASLRISIRQPVSRAANLAF